MARLNIPERYRAGVSKIKRLDEQTVREIRAALDSALTVGDLNQSASAERLDQVATRAITNVTHANSDDFRQIAQALVSLYVVRSTRDVAVEEFVEDVSEALAGLEEPELALQSNERERFKQNLITLLSADIFAIVAKALDLRTDDERIFCHARILTDLRPVFGRNINEGPKAMVLVHLLKLGYHSADDKQHKEFFLSLDADDLRTLRELIDRAEAKAKSLKSTVKDVRIFGIPRE